MDQTLRMYAIVRNDLGMLSGKMASQAGHAFVGVFYDALQSSPSLIADYTVEHPKSPGTKICLQADSLDAITRAHEEAKRRGIPAFLVVDSGCSNFFAGQPIVTALGLGPAKRRDIKKIVGRFQLLA